MASRVIRGVALAAGLMCGAATAAAQHTVVQNNGVSGRIEMDYNAAEKVTQMRTFGPDGKLQQQADYEYLPGHYGPQQTDTTYWPNGRIRKLAHTTYDESANFTSDSIQVFDESGKQVAGNKVTHDPWTGVYRCWEWRAATQDYQAVECPAGEEESGGAEKEVKRFTYEEVIQHLEAAWKRAQQERKIGHIRPATPVQPPVTTVAKEVGVVLPAQLRAGERVSGTVVEDPGQYDQIPEVAVTRVSVPFESVGEASQLSGWFFETPGEKPRRADGPITFVVPRSGSELSITFRQAGNPAHAVSQTLNLSLDSAEKQPPISFFAAALCLKDELCMVSGPFSGDSSKTLAAFGDRPATIVAETSGAAYLRIPDLTEPGARPLFISEGQKVVALPVVIGELVIRNNHRELKAGDTLIMFPALEGLGDMPESEWQPGNFPASSLTRARRQIPEFQLPKGRREDQEKLGVEANREEEEKKGGEILLVIKNVTPEQISLRSSKNEMLVFRLSDQSFRRGDFKYDLVVEAKQAGKVDVKGYVIPFLAPIAGQEFEVKTAAAR